MSTLDPDGEDPSQKASRLAARAARFNKSAPGKRNKELEDARAKERQAFEAQGLINSGKTELGDAVDMRGTCETMCSPFEMETRNIRMEVHPFERGVDDKLDPAKAVAAYTRSDAGAGHGSSAILPSDLRTPATLVRTLDYLFSEVMPLPPTNTSSQSIDRKALGHSAGFIRDRTRAIRKEFAMQSTWGHLEAIASFERIARWHILCLRELQEETGFNSDMHIDSAELGRCFTSLRHLYNDRREESGLEMPCPHEPEMRAYMLIFDLANKSVSIPTSELPAVILDDPLVKLAWEIRKSAQRNFDSQKEGSKSNAELGSNLINRYIRLMKQKDVPFLLSCLVEVRLRDMRRSALRAMTRTYPRLKTEPTRVNDAGEVVERKMVLIDNLTRILGCEEQDQGESAWQDVVPSSKSPEDEAVNVVSRFDLEVWPDKHQPVGALINLGAVFNDNQDAPYTRRWKAITEKRNGLSLVDIVNGKAGVLASSTPTARQPAPVSTFKPAPAFKRPNMTSTPSTSGSAFTSSLGKPVQPSPPPPSFAFAPAPVPTPVEPVAKQSSWFDKKVTFAPTPTPTPPPSTTPFSFAPPPVSSPAPAPEPAPVAPAPPVASTAPPLFASLAPPAASPSLATKSPTTLPLSPAPASPRPVSSIAPPIPTPIATPKVDLETQRRVRRKILPALCDTLIAEVIAKKLGPMQIDVEIDVKRARAASAHAQAKAARQAQITKYAEETYNVLLEQVITTCAREAAFAERYRRARLCRILRQWRDWAETQREDRKAAILERQAAYESLGSMGLSSSSFACDSTPIAQMERLDPFAADVMLHQTERTKDHFYSPSTFLATTARHLAQTLQPASSSSSSIFQTLISPSKNAATPSSKGAFEWLKSKFYPTDRDAFVQDGITFEADIMGSRTQGTSVGLMVLEAPLQTWSTEQQRKNAADARVRLEQFAKCAGNLANEYSPGLLIVTWEDESLEEVTERLGIDESLISFDRVATLSLESAEDLDTRFATALEDLFAEGPVRQQVIVDLQHATNRLYPHWERLMAIIRLSVSTQSLDVKDTCEILNAGLKGIEGLDRAVQSALGDIEICDTSTYDAIELPQFDFVVKSSTTQTDLADAIASYLQEGTFAETSDVGLFITATRQAAFHSRPLPIDGILQSLAMMVFSNISSTSLPLRAFFPTQEGCEGYISTYLQTISSRYQDHINACIQTINALQPPLASSSSKLSTPSPKNLKRTHSRISLENISPRAKEMKALKNAKLLKAMREVESTLGSLEMEERIGINGVY